MSKEETAADDSKAKTLGESIKEFNVTNSEDQKGFQSLLTIIGMIAGAIFMFIYNMDHVVNFVYNISDVVKPIHDRIQDFILLKFPYAAIILPVANAINASTIIYNESVKNKQVYYWLHSLFLVLFTAFGGGFLAPMLMGKTSLPIHNDLIIPITIVTWYFVFNVPGVCDFLTSKPVKTIWCIFLGLFRTHAVCNIVKYAAGRLEPSAFYPISLFGPIIVGVMLGSGGQFFPTDKGFKAIENGTPWPIQGSVITATFYHLMLVDQTGFLGVLLRNILGTYNDSQARMVLASMHIITCLAQTNFHPEANLFTPIHKFLYLIFQVQGPAPLGVEQKPFPQTVGWPYETRIALERFLELSRVLCVIAIVVLHIYCTQPQITLYAGNRITVSGNNAIMGNCQMMPSFRACKPHLLRLEKDQNKYALTSYDNSKSAGEKLWSTHFSSRADAPNYFTLTQDGKLKLVRYNDQDKTETEVWSSSKAICGDIKGDWAVKLTLDRVTGIPQVTCADGSEHQVKEQ